MKKNVTKKENKFTLDKFEVAKLKNPKMILGGNEKPTITIKTLQPPSE